MTPREQLIFITYSIVALCCLYRVVVASVEARG